MEKARRKAKKEKARITKITKDMTMSEIIEKFPETSDSFMQLGLGCAFCPYASQETIEQGSLTHGLDPDEVIKKLNDSINKKLKSKK